MTEASQHTCHVMVMPDRKASKSESRGRWGWGEGSFLGELRASSPDPTIIMKPKVTRNLTTCQVC